MDIVVSKVTACFKADIESAGILLPEQVDTYSPLQFAVKRQLECLFKKFQESDKTTAAQNSAAEVKFFRANEACKNWVIPTNVDRETQKVLEFLRRDLGTFCTAITDNATPLSVLRNGRLSPGSNRLTKETSAYGKLFGSPVVSYSNDSQLWLVSQWTKRLQEQGMSVSQLTPHKPRMRQAFCKMFFVPKDAECARAACTGSVVGVFGQLGLGRMIEDGMRCAYNISIKRQAEVNQLILAFPGMSTLDLSSASDTIAWNMLKWLLPPAFVGLLSIWRDTHMVSPKGENIELHMVATMGNGFTFPLETLIFSAVVRAVYKLRGISWDRRKLVMEDFTFHRAPTSYGTFGDDIIVKEEAYDIVERVLTLLGFTVNPTKSFKSGDFRESCGRDLYKGVDVRPVFVKRLELPADYCVAYNGLQAWGKTWGIALPKTLGILRARGPSFLSHRVPVWENEDAGYQTHMVQNRNVVTYRAFEPVPKRLITDAAGEYFLAGDRELKIHESAVLQASLIATIDTDGFTERPFAREYRAVYRRTHNWEHKPQGAAWLGMKRAKLDVPAKRVVESLKDVVSAVSVREDVPCATDQGIDGCVENIEVVSQETPRLEPPEPTAP